MAIDRLVTIRREGQRILLLLNGTLVMDMPAEAATAIAKAILSHAKQAEEEKNPQQLIADQAILLRMGVPFGLTNNSKILKESFKESQYVKAPPGVLCIPSQSVAGVPSVSHVPGENDGRRAAD